MITAQINAGEPHPKSTMPPTFENAPSRDRRPGISHFQKHVDREMRATALGQTSSFEK
jgi:hypothetical protein